MNLRTTSSTDHRSLITRHFILFLLLSTLSAHATRDLLVANPATNSILRFDGQTGASKGHFVAPGAGGLSDPRQMQQGPDGALYVADYLEDRVKCFSNVDGSLVRESLNAAGNLNCSQSLEFHDDYLYVFGRANGACTTNRLVNRLNLDGLMLVDTLVINTAYKYYLSNQAA